MTFTDKFSPRTLHISVIEQALAQLSGLVSNLSDFICKMKL